MFRTISFKTLPNLGTIVQEKKPKNYDLCFLLKLLLLWTCLADLEIPMATGSSFKPLSSDQLNQPADNILSRKYSYHLKTF